VGRLTAAAPKIFDRPDVGDTMGGHGWIVTVFDNDHNTADQVVGILLVATSCSIEEAEMETWEIHHLGRSVVHHGRKEECETAADIIREIGIRVTVTEE
jgi:ATP-dependent Clp protease adapter protein ClpS